MFQIALHSLVSASVYSLVGVGLSLILRIVGVFHFAHAAVFASAAYMAFLFSVCMGLPFFFRLS